MARVSRTALARLPVRHCANPIVLRALSTDFFPPPSLSLRTTLFVLSLCCHVSSMRSTLSLPCYSPWSTPGGYRLSSPTSSDISCDSAQVHAARADREDAHARVYGSIVLGGEVYCPHSFKEQRYEPPGSPGDSFGPSSARSSSHGWSMTTGTHPGSSLCDHCDAASPFEPKRLRRRVVLMCLLFAQIAKAEVERFLSTLAVFGSNFNVGPKRVQQIDPTRRMSQQDPPPW